MNGEIFLLHLITLSIHPTNHPFIYPSIQLVNRRLDTKLSIEEAPAQLDAYIWIWDHLLIIM